MRSFAWLALLLLSCGTTLDGGIHAAACNSAEAAGLPICTTGDRCNTATDCIPACSTVGCLEGACTYRTGSCTTPGCAGEATAAQCLNCGRVATKRETALTECLCTACAAACGASVLCTDAGPLIADECATCAINALVHPGLCSSDARFQDACFGGTTTCRAAAQAIVACRR